MYNSEMKAKSTAKSGFDNGVYKTDRKLESSTFEENSQCAKNELNNLSASTVNGPKKKLFGIKSKSQDLIDSNNVRNMKAIEEAKLMLKEKLKKSKYFSKFKDFYMKKDQFSISMTKNDKTIDNKEIVRSNNNDLYQIVGIGSFNNPASSRVSQSKISIGNPQPMLLNQIILQDPNF